jgi:parvulin-like peptidyl-prolyl isomerase
MKDINMRKLSWALIGFVALLTVGLRGEILEQLLVKVNGEVLTKTELEQRQLRALRDRTDINSGASDDALKRAIAEITPAILVDIVDEMLLVQRGRELGQTMTDDQFKSILDNLRKDNNITTEEQFQAALKQEGMTMLDLRKMFERQTLINRVQQQEVMSKIDVNEEEARRYFEAHSNEFTTQPGVTLREILVSVPTEKEGVNVGKDEEARTKAEALRARALKGEAFEKLAAENSDAASKANGGLVGPISRDELAPDFQKLIDPLRAGQITTVVRSRQGWQFFKLELRTESDRLTFEQARPQIADRIANEKRASELEKYLVKLREQALIEWKNEELHKAYDQGRAARAAKTPPAG